jgi:aldose 1-epimerase
MYQHSTHSFGQYTLHRLEDPLTGHAFSVVPEAGANVLCLEFDGFNILDGFETPEELAAGKWGKSTLLFPFPNRLLDGRFAHEGQTYQWPINNADTGNAIHGFVRSEAFALRSVVTTESDAQITLGLNYAGQHAFYPFPFDLEVRFRIGDDRVFGLSVQVQNRSVATLPFGFGWHPYFRLTPRADDHDLLLAKGQRVEIDERMIPTGHLHEQPDFQALSRIGHTFLDNCFRAETTPDGQYAVHLEADGRRLTMQADVADWPYFQVFTPPHRTSVAMEPMTCNIDGFNNGDGLIRLAPEATWQAACTFELSSTDQL